MRETGKAERPGDSKCGGLWWAVMWVGDKCGARSTPRPSGLCIAFSLEEEKLANLYQPMYTFSGNPLSLSSKLCLLV